MKQGLRLAARALGSYLVLGIVCLLILMGIEWLWLSIALNALLILGVSSMMFFDGGAQGERAATASATMLRVKAEGRNTDSLQKEGFSVKAGVVCMVAVLLPLMIVAGANLIAEPHYPPVIVNPVSDEQLEAEFERMANGENLPEGIEHVDGTARSVDQGATDAPEQAEDEVAVNPFSVVARIVFVPVFSVYTLFADNPHGLNIVFVFAALFFALPEGLGYLCGPGFRRKKLEAIQKGKQKKMRNLKVNKQKREPKQPKHEV